MEKLMEKFRGGVIAIAIASIAIVACVCMFSTSANAESNVDPTPTGTAKLTQEVEAAKNASFSATFDYAFAEITADDPDLSASLSVAAENGNVTSPVTKEDISGTNNSTYKNSMDFTFLDSITWPRTGLFEYTISHAIRTASPAPVPDATWSDKSKYSNYTLRVYVKNGTSGFEVDGITLETVGKNPPPEEKVAEIVYTNKLVTTSDLTIKKIVTGTYGDKTHPFTFAITLYDSEKGVGDSVTATRSGTTTTNFTFNFNAEHEGTCATTITLTDQQTLKFEALTTGTTYKIVEPGSTGTGADPVVADYTAKATSTSVNTAGNPIVYNTPEQDKGTGITVEYNTSGNTAAIVGQGSGNETDVTNDLTITPTGFLIDAAPYMLMIGIPIIALIIWIVVRKRRAARQF